MRFIANFQSPCRHGAAFPPFSPFRRALARGLVLPFTLAAPAAEAARPMITDDARIVDEKSCQIESWMKKSRDGSESWALPACNFTGNLELAAGAVHVRDTVGGRTTDLTLQGKTLFRPLAPNDWGVGLVAGVLHHPQSDAGGRDWYAYVPASVSFRDDRFVLHGNLGWLREQEVGAHRLTWGVGSETQLGGRSWLIAETFGQNQGRPSYQVGLRHWIVPDRLQVDATVGDRFGGDDRERWFSIGLRWLSLPFLP